MMNFMLVLKIPKEESIFKKNFHRESILSIQVIVYNFVLAHA